MFMWGGAVGVLKVKMKVIVGLLLFSQDLTVILNESTTPWGQSSSMISSFLHSLRSAHFMTLLLELRVLCADACTGQPAISVRASSLALYVRLSVSTNTLPFCWHPTDFSVPTAACRALLSTNGEIINKGLLTSDGEIITNFGKLVCVKTPSPSSESVSAVFLLLLTVSLLVLLCSAASMFLRKFVLLTPHPPRSPNGR